MASTVSHPNKSSSTRTLHYVRRRFRNNSLRTHPQPNLHSGLKHERNILVQFITSSSTHIHAMLNGIRGSPYILGIPLHLGLAWNKRRSSIDVNHPNRINIGISIDIQSATQAYRIPRSPAPNTWIIIPEPKPDHP